MCFIFSYFSVHGVISGNFCSISFTESILPVVVTFVCTNERKNNVPRLFPPTQGLCVATLFCFCNGEVIAQVKRRWRIHFFRPRANSYTATQVSVRTGCFSSLSYCSRQKKREAEVVDPNSDKIRFSLHCSFRLQMFSFSGFLFTREKNLHFPSVIMSFN
jgi:hypothetical protein